MEPGAARRVLPEYSEGKTMFQYALLFLMISLATGAVGLVNVSDITRRIAFGLFALFFLLFAIVMGIAWMIGEAIV